MKNVILVDFPLTENWEFHRALEEASKKTWIVESLVSNQHGSVWLKLLRYWKYFAMPFRIFINRKQYSTVLAWQQFYGLILAFYLRLFRVKDAPEITIMTFIYKSKKGIVGKIYAWFINYVVTSSYIKKIIVFSQSEKEYYAKLFDVPEEMFVAEKLGVMSMEYDNCKYNRDAKYYIAAGRSNRDYEFLRLVWPQTGEKLKIICDICKDVDTENITYYRDCHGEEYIKELAKSYAVIIPLKNDNISSGQLVFLQAMMMGKPVIVTKSDTISNYVYDGINGLIIDKTKESLEDAIQKLEDEIFYEKISNNAKQIFEKEFTLYAMGKRIGQYV